MERLEILKVTQLCFWVVVVLRTLLTCHRSVMPASAPARKFAILIYGFHGLQKGQNDGGLFVLFCCGLLWADAGCWQGLFLISICKAR